jgi:Flp pilus assembly protein TadG
MASPQPSKSRRSRQGGVALVILSLLIFTVLIPIVGLAIDGGILFLVKQQMAAAADAATLAGGRSLSVGMDLASQTASATATMNAFFNANFPPGAWGTTNPTVTTSVVQATLSTRVATLDASVTAPTLFMRVIGFNTSRLAVHGQATRRDVNIILVLDRSGSMNNGGACATMVTQARTFVSQFTNGRDTLGLVTFNSGSNVDYTPNVNFKTASPSLDTILSQLQCGGGTNTAQALYSAWQQIKAVNLPGVLNLIVLFTDGQPNAISGDFNGSNPLSIFELHTQTDTRYDSQSYDTLVSVPPTSCTAGTATYGVIEDASSSDYALTGYTIGPVTGSSGSISNTTYPVITGTGSCNFSIDYTTMREDIAYIPSQDHWGTSTSGYKGSDNYLSGPYQGKMRLDRPLGTTIAATNATDNIATTIRGDTTYNPVIYTIGLGGTVAQAIDADLLERLANDPRASNYNPAKTAGRFVYASNATELGQAFQSIASQILRLSQ